MIIHKVTADYIRGFADADGGFSGHIIYLVNDDLQLLDKIFCEIKLLGIEAGWIVQQQGNYEPTGRIQITGLVNLVKYAMLIGFSMDTKQQKLEEYIKFASREGRAYNPDDYDQYLDMKFQKLSYRKMAQRLNLSPSAIHRREKLRVYPLNEATLNGIREIRNK